VLLVWQTVIAVFLVVAALYAIRGIADNSRSMYQFQLRSIADIGFAIEEAASMQEGSRSAALDDFYHRYRTQWETASGTSPDAIRFRNNLVREGESYLIEKESDVLTRLGKALRSGNAQDVRENLATLNEINSRYADLANEYVVKHTTNARMWLLTTGTAGILLTLSLGLRVYRAVIPRARLLVERVRKFQDTGVHERIGDLGNDYIGMLANALDAGFTAITERERQRSEFLAIAAHELKTPVTSIQGYVSLVVSHPEERSLQLRALEIINRQSWRLSRLIDGLFLAMRARSKDLHFTPKHFDLSALVERVLDEMKPFIPEKVFSSEIHPGVRILGDEALLEHALWSLFTCASALVSGQSPIEIRLYIEGNRARLTVDIDEGGVSLPAMEELFLPFRWVEYETGTSIRLAIGLYLCREIVRVHNGQLRVQQSDKLPEFIMELPA
jgi:signal transduction histidine kinase